MSDNLELAFDPGSSLTKCIYRVNAGRIQSLLMGPELMKVSTDSVQQQSRMGIATPINDAWLKLRKRDESCYLIGDLARQFRAAVQLGDLKYESAVIKALSVIGAIAQKEALSAADMTVSITALLPLGEFADRKKFESSLRQHLKRFYFRSKRLSAELVNIAVMPEGAGFAFEQLGKRGEEWFTSREAICCLMLGHRNSSFLVFSHGAINRKASNTSNLGFVQLVDKVIERTSGQDRDTLSRSLYEIGNDISPQNSKLRSLAKSKAVKHVSQEISDLSRAIVTAKQEYWLLLRNWLDELAPSRVDEFCIGGGASYYMRHELHEYLVWAQPYFVQPPGTIEQIAAGNEDPSLKRRMVDVWLMFQQIYLQGENLKEAEAPTNNVA